MIELVSKVVPLLVLLTEMVSQLAYYVIDLNGPIVGMEKILDISQENYRDFEICGILIQVISILSSYHPSIFS